MTHYEHAHLWMQFNDDDGGSVSGAGVDYFGGSYGWKQELLSNSPQFQHERWTAVYKRIGRLSQEGWELVSVTGMRTATDFWFKRPV
jgi:hypothetical protein